MYDHYGEPGFAHYDTVLMFVRRFGKLYHEKYVFVPVYLTVDGRWASCGDAEQWEIGYKHEPKLRPVPVEFADKVVDEAARRPCVAGNYIEDLLSLKRNGILKNRGWVF